MSPINSNSLAVLVGPSWPSPSRLAAPSKPHLRHRHDRHHRLAAAAACTFVFACQSALSAFTMRPGDNVTFHLTWYCSPSSRSSIPTILQMSPVWPLVCPTATPCHVGYAGILTRLRLRHPSPPPTRSSNETNRCVKV